MKKLFLFLIIPFLLGATIPEPPKDDTASPQVQQYLKTIYEELKRDNAEEGLKLPSGAIFFMLTGSCPSGSTDVTATYSGKFLRINATQGTTGGADTDSVTLSEANLPSHTHAAGTLAAANESAHTHTAGWAESGSSSGVVLLGSGFTSGATTPQTGAGSAHGHTISGSTGAIGSGTAFLVDTIPSFLTCKMCQVN